MNDKIKSWRNKKLTDFELLLSNVWEMKWFNIFMKKTFGPKVWSRFYKEVLIDKKKSNLIMYAP